MLDGAHVGDHSHVFDTASGVAERGARIVTWITAAMTVVEIWAG